MRRKTLRLMSWKSEPENIEPAGQEADSWLTPQSSHALAPANSDAHHYDRGCQRDRHLDPEFGSAPLEWHEDISHIGRIRRQKVRKVLGGEEPVPRACRLQEIGEGPLDGHEDREKNRS